MGILVGVAPTIIIAELHTGIRSDPVLITNLAMTWNGTFTFLIFSLAGSGTVVLFLGAKLEGILSGIGSRSRLPIEVTVAQHHIIFIGAALFQCITLFSTIGCVRDACKPLFGTSTRDSAINVIILLAAINSSTFHWLLSKLHVVPVTFSIRNVQIVQLASVMSLGIFK
jgi:hypothetical protein